MTDDFESDQSADTPSARPGRPVTRRRVLLPTLLTFGVLLFLLAIFTGVWTDRLWFESVGYSDVFSRLLVTRTLLFVILGAVFATAVVANVVIAYRLQPLLPIRSRRFDPVARYREVITPIRGRVATGIFLLLGVTAGSIGSGHWQQYMLWRNKVSFGQQDVYGFGKDISFFVFDYPWYRFLLSYGFTLLVMCILAAAATHYLYGGITLQGRDRVSPSAQAHLSVLLGLFMLLKAVAYYMDRFGLAISDGGLFTGISFTDDHARIPSKNILLVIAIICALLFFANVVRRSLLLPGIGLGLLVLSSILIGGIFPAVMQSLQVKPSEPDKEGPYIAQNIVATRTAYGVAGVEVRAYDAQTSLSSLELTEAADATPGTRLLDPTLVSPAFEQLQQVRGYYSMAQTLDVDRYPVEGEQAQDMVIAARELNLDGLQDSQRNWNNDHTVYTHGLGVVAAFGNERGANGAPVWAVEDLPPQATIPSLDITQPRIYFGENSPQYSIVGQPEGVDSGIEVDIPQAGADDEAASTTTYTGTGGVDVGGFFNQALYAVKFGEPNILLSGRVNAASQILYDRDPRERVSKVAPWLTVDGNTYPAVVEGRIVWIVDAYTTSSSYPGSQLRSLEDATSDSLTDQGSYATLPNDQVNYMRNSVKAVVDAYDGTVALYAWDETDPILQAWERAFPGTVAPRSEITPELLAHLRYPEDLFKVQRDILSTYHVEDAQTFYQGDQRWKIPEDPTNTNSTQPPFYLSVQRPGEATPEFSLTSVYLPNSRQNLAAFVSVNSEATDTTPESGYGALQILQLPTDTSVSGPSQVANQFQTDSRVTDALLSFKQSGTQVLFGNLLTLPVGDKLLYVQPVYTQRTATEGTYPVLQFVIASFGDDVGFGRSLDEALQVALGETTPPTTPGGTEPPPPGSGDVVDLLNQAQAKYEEAQQALAVQDLAAYQAAIDEMNALVEQARQALAEEAGTPTTEPTPTETPSP